MSKNWLTVAIRGLNESPLLEGTELFSLNKFPARSTWKVLRVLVIHVIV